MTTAAMTGKFNRSSYLSTGRLPSPERATNLVSEAHNRFKSNTEGGNSTVYRALAPVPSDLFGVCVGTSSNVYAPEVKWNFIHAGLSRFARRTLATNHNARGGMNT